MKYIRICKVAFTYNVLPDLVPQQSKRISHNLACGRKNGRLTQCVWTGAFAQFYLKCQVRHYIWLLLKTFLLVNGQPTHSKRKEIILKFILILVQYVKRYQSFERENKRIRIKSGNRISLLTFNFPLVGIICAFALYYHALSGDNF